MGIDNMYVYMYECRCVYSSIKRIAKEVREAGTFKLIIR